MTQIPFLTGSDVADLASPAEYVDAVRDGYRQRGEGAPAVPRTSLERDEPDGKLTGYTAILPESGVMGGYMYSAGFSAGDAWFVLPLFDAERGEPLALLDGAAMNPYKTGAVGAVGIDSLARTDSTSLALIGTGSQARGQLLAAATVREFETVRVYSPTRDHRESFAAEFDERLEPDVVAVESSSEAVRGADVVVTATRATEPVFDGSDLDAGTHVTAIGQYQTTARELDTRTIAQATYVPDLRERVFQDAGSFLIARDAGAIGDDHVHAELGHVVAGVKPGRTADDEITVFDSGGTAIETIAAAAMLYERAVAAGRGTMIDVDAGSDAMQL